MARIVIGFLRHLLAHTHRYPTIPFMILKLNAYWRLMRFDRPIGILLLLWPTLWALWIAGEGSPSAKNILIFCTGVVLMRAAGCIMNDVADRDFDPHVERTRSRPLASGELSYPFFKRWTHFPQVVLGVAFGWGIPMAFAAETGQVAFAAWLILLINVLWSVIYDTLYAMVDREDDIAIGLKSTAILFGESDLLVLRILKIIMTGLLLWLGLMLQFSWPWFVGVAVAALLFVRQQYKVRQRHRDRCFEAFLNNNWVGVAIFAGLFVNYLIH
jgi:4-hydroxybenzoate polyprenyltransferase